MQQISMNCKIYFPMKNVCTKIAITIFAGNYCTNDLTVFDVLSDTKETCEYSVWALRIISLKKTFQQK